MMCTYVFLCVHMSHVFPWRPEEDSRSFGVGVTEGCRYPWQTLKIHFQSFLRKSTVHSWTLGHLSRFLHSFFKTKLLFSFLDVGRKTAVQNSVPFLKTCRKVHALSLHGSDFPKETLHAMTSKDEGCVQAK